MMTRPTLRWIVHGTLATAGLLALTLTATGQTPPPADDPRFTGLSTVLEGKDLSVARRRFEPGARRPGTATTTASCSTWSRAACARRRRASP